MKKNCSKCGKRIKGVYEFCPYCGNIIENREEDWGMLGKNDLVNKNNEIKLPFGFNTIFNSLMNSLNKEMAELNKTSAIQDQDKRKTGLVKNGISINISSSGNAPPKVSVSYFGDEKAKKSKKVKEAEPRLFSDIKTKKFLSLSKEEPKTSLRRLSKKIVYEIELTGVSSIEDVSIVKLENSIEIRAIAKDKAYFKIIPINLPLIDYDFLDEKLILELKA
ncbi:MAG: zinc ribbon domain-containing protein [Nanoarchaeota archaeon]|nr:zinc ribbon domain-containing protein [Nanoarchaeota archaeon]